MVEPYQHSDPHPYCVPGDATPASFAAWIASHPGWTSERTYVGDSVRTGAPLFNFKATNGVRWQLWADYGPVTERRPQRWGLAHAGDVVKAAVPPPQVRTAFTWAELCVEWQAAMEQTPAVVESASAMEVESTPTGEESYGG